MDIFLFIIYIIAVVALPYFIIKYTLKTLDKSKYRTFAIVVLVLSCIIFFMLLISTRFIPGAVKDYVNAGINITENKLNEISPGYTDQVLDKEKIKNMLQDTKQMRHNLKEYTQGASFITSIIGVDVYLSFFEVFASKLDDNIALFEQRNVPFTIHNILQYIQDETNVETKRIVAIIALSLFLNSLIIYGLVLLFVFAIKKKWINVEYKSVIYGDNV